MRLRLVFVVLLLSLMAHKCEQQQPTIGIIWIKNGKPDDAVNAAWKQAVSDLGPLGVDWEARLDGWVIEINTEEMWPSLLNKNHMIYGQTFLDKKKMLIDWSLTSLCHEMLESQWPGFHNEISDNYKSVDDHWCSKKSF